MNSSNGYLTALPVAGRRITVFGAEGNALGHIGALRQADAMVSVVADWAAPAVQDLVARGLIRWHRRSYQETDLEEPWLVVAATGDPCLDQRIARDCEAVRLWCLVASTDRAPDPSVDGSSSGQVTLVGGGPGDPGLLTVAGRDALRRADVVIADRLAPLGALTEVRPGALILDVGKVPRGPATPQEDINRLLVQHAQAGRDVVRLKGGDSFLFGRGGEELQACAQAGLRVRVIPGVTSALAVPAAAWIPVTHRGLNQGFTVVSGHVPPGDPQSTLDYASLARSGTALVLLMAVATLPAITKALLDAGLAPGTPAATIADGTLPGQRVIRATVATIAEEVAAADITAPAITVLGEVAGFDPAALPAHHLNGSPHLI